MLRNVCKVLLVLILIIQVVNMFGNRSLGISILTITATVVIATILVKDRMY